MTSNFSIEKPSPETIPSLALLTKNLLPINYPDRFFSQLSDPPCDSNSYSMARVAIWHSSRGDGTIKDQIVGGICGRIKAVLKDGDKEGDKECELYIATLAVLAPWRGQGIAAALLRELVSAAVAFADWTSSGSLKWHDGPQTYNTNDGGGVCTVASPPLPRFGRLTSVLAHVWETNETGLDWYRAQGFTASDIIRGYYRRLQPDGARLVRRNVLGLVLMNGHGSSEEQEEQQDNVEPVAEE